MVILTGSTAWGQATTTIQSTNAATFNCGDPANLIVTFDTTNFGPGYDINDFVLEASTNGFLSFDTYLPISVTPLGAPSLQISVVLPSDIVQEGIQIRVNSPDTDVPTVDVSTITVVNFEIGSQVTSGPYCEGDPIQFNFTAGAGIDISNVYTLEARVLPAGAFNAVGFLPGNAISGIITGAIPDGTGGNMLEFRITASNPAVNSCNESGVVAIGGPSSITDQPDNDQTDICPGGSASWSATPAVGASTEWYKMCLDSFFVTLRDSLPIL
ncbi:MAG: hypothetical protein AAF242_13375, partial [Bacteroidota bacterium]